MKKNILASSFLLMMVIGLFLTMLMSCTDEIPLYTVRFDSQGGSAVSAKEAFKGTRITEPAAPTRANHEFGGWYKDAGLSSAWDFDKDTVTSDLTLYAKWTANTYMVTFDAQGGYNLSDLSMDVEYGGTYGQMPTVEKLGQTFNGWWTGTVGAGVLIIPSSLVQIESSQILFAHWIDGYTIYFDSSGGIIPNPEYKAVKFGDRYGSLATTSRVGYVFDGWYTGVEGTGDKITADSVLDMAESKTLYGNWVPETYIVTFNAQGGITPTPATKDVTYALTYGMLATASRDGYTFNGWWTQPNGEGIQITGDSTVSITEDQTLYAKWVANEYTVTFDAQGGTTLSPATKEVTYASKYGTLATTTRDDYVFDGWWTAPDGGGTQITPDSTVSLIADQTLYAKWTHQLTMTYDAQGGINLTPTSKTVIYGKTYGPLATTVRLGHTLTGWTTGPNGTGKQIATDSIVEDPEDHFLYAVWVLSTQTITFDPEGGSIAEPQIKIVTYGQPYGELARSTRDGYTFAGWWTGENGTGTEITEATVFTGASDRSLYAKWIFDVYTGPAGGLVFYENPNWKVDGWKYLEAAPDGWYDGDADSHGVYSSEDGDPFFQWGASGYVLNPSTTGTGIGTGSSNTANIVNFHDTLWAQYPEKGDYYTNPTEYNNKNDGTVAATVCADYRGGGYSDWFLPSKDELNLMFQILHLNNFSTFENFYWSSSEDDADDAWMQNFYGEGSQRVFWRDFTYAIRPIRAF